MDASRIANVSAAWLVGFAGTPSADPRAGRARALAALMAQLFEDTLEIGDSTSSDDQTPARPWGRHVSCRGDRRDVVTGVAAAIEAARGERVIVVGDADPGVTAELLLALVAWPESAVVMATDAAGPSPLRAIYRCDDLRARARAVLESGDPPPSVDTFLAGLEVAQVPFARLGLAGAPFPLFAELADSRVGSGGVG